ncbi:MAG: L-serine ammonia-lyase, iron-sulfur-dependent, subunit alpha [Candidatus Aminicenantes bacterium]|nr:L-serine ammonia-lyase, iron-sulfur-dependent, subunit alpha [Candidatus Aminicenantes bacterium]
MEFISILNDVLGPVMRGPSSSHTAGSYHIGRLVRALLGGAPARAEFTFDPSGSYAATYRQQGVDLALTAGLLGWPMTDERFARALALAPKLGLRPRFRVAPLEGADHPNAVAIELISKDGRTLRAAARSIGGGMILLTELDGHPVRIDGKSHEVLVLVAARSAEKAGAVVAADGRTIGEPACSSRGGRTFLAFKRTAALSAEALAGLGRLEGVHETWTAPPLFFTRKGEPLFLSAAEMTALARRRRMSLGRAALAYEARLLGLAKRDVLEEMGRRFEVMRRSVRDGLAGRGLGMKLLEPTAGRIFGAEARGRLPSGGFQTRAAARAMAALHVSNSGGVVCAAPTGGSAGVLPGVLVTLAEDRGLDEAGAALALLAAGAVGLIVARRATFAAEVAGCQVEIGAAGAMATAAVVEAAGGTAAQAADAAAISLQNTMGSVCDLVQGLCEIPCHTRNAVAASSAFVCADLVLGGYANPIPLDDTIDASFAAGRMLPAELRCTAKGGLAVTPSALALKGGRSK